jgi:hypothetical protein
MGKAAVEEEVRGEEGEEEEEEEEVGRGATDERGRLTCSRCYNFLCDVNASALQFGVAERGKQSSAGVKQRGALR